MSHFCLRRHGRSILRLVCCVALTAHAEHTYPHGDDGATRPERRSPTTGRGYSSSPNEQWIDARGRGL